MPYYIFAWITSIAYSLETLLGKLISKYQVDNPWLFNFVWYLFILLLTIPVAVLNGASLPTFWTNIFLAAIFYALGGAFYIIALRLLDVSVISPLFNLRTVSAAILGTLFLGETYSGFQYFLMVAIVIAGIFVTLDEKFSFKSFFQKSTSVMIFEVFLLSLMSIFINKAVTETGFWEVTLWMPIIAQVLLLLTIPLFLKDLPKIGGRHLGSIFIMSLLGVVGTLSANKAFADNVALSTTIISLPISMVIVIILSFFYPKLLEKHPPKVYFVRITSAVIMLVLTLKLTL